MNTWVKDRYTVTCDTARMDLAVITEFLASSYWAKNIPRATVEKSVANSVCFALLEDERQIGFARVVTDRAAIAYLADVFVLPEHRGKGLSKWLMECVFAHPELQGLRRWVLATLDAHGLYEKYGFTPLRRPELFMERHDPDIYGARR